MSQYEEDAEAYAAGDYPEEDGDHALYDLCPAVEALDRAAERINAGLCPHCGAKVVERRVLGRTAYAQPCGHRLGLIDRPKGRKRKAVRA